MSIRTILISALALVFGASAAIWVNMIRANPNGPAPETVAVPPTVIGMVTFWLRAPVSRAVAVTVPTPSLTVAVAHVNWLVQIAHPVPKRL